MPGCPVRYRSGDDRLCREHVREDGWPASRPRRPSHVRELAGRDRMRSRQDFVRFFWLIRARMPASHDSLSGMRRPFFAYHSAHH